MRTRQLLSVALAVASLAACSADTVTGPSPGAIRASHAAGVDTAAVDLAYVCGNLFTITNANDEAVTVEWQLNTSATVTSVTVPAGATVEVTAPFQQTMVLYLAGHVIEVEQNVGIQSCPGTGGGGGGTPAPADTAAIVVEYLCQNIFAIINPTDQAFTLTWRLNSPASTLTTVVVAAHDTVYVTAPFQQTFALYYEGQPIEIVQNPGIQGCPTRDLVDVRPGGEPNDVNLKAKGVLPVAILTTEWFDACSVDVSTVTIEDVHVDVKPNGAYHYACEDVDGDGDLDLLVFFRIQDLVDAGVLMPTTTELIVTWMWGGWPQSGTDEVRVVNW